MLEYNKFIHLQTLFLLEEEVAKDSHGRANGTKIHEQGVSSVGAMGAVTPPLKYKFCSYIQALGLI
jgi:hypothetical protein